MLVNLGHVTTALLLSQAHILATSTTDTIGLGAWVALRVMTLIKGPICDEPARNPSDSPWFLKEACNTGTCASVS